MVNLIGNITDSQGLGLTGTLILTLNDPQQSGNKLLTLAPAEFAIASGVVNINVEPCLNVRLQFKVGENFYLDFNTDIPVATSINISDLIPAEPRETLELNLLRVAAILTQVPEYLTQIKTQFNYRGAWLIGSIYSRDDLVDYAGSSYTWISPLTANSTPPSSNWQLIASKGTTGSGTSGSSSAYGVAWNGDTAAPSKSIIYNTLESTFAKITSYSNLALKNDTILTGVPISPTAVVSTNTAQIATTAFIWQALASILNPAASDAPYAPDTALNDNTSKIANTKALMAAIAALGVVARPSSFSIGSITVCYGLYTSASLSWTAATEQTFIIPYPNSLAIATPLVYLAQWQSSGGATGMVNARCNPNTASNFNLSLRTANTITSVISSYWLAIGTN